ncbi:MAG: hypothetical protein ABEJ99_03245 [Candidatus Nanohaloarchaea archaeon]
MNVLRAEWAEQEALENSYSAVETAYTEGLISVIIPVISSAFESWTQDQLENHEAIASRDSGQGYTVPVHAGRPIESWNEMHEVASNYLGLTDDFQDRIFEDVRQVRNQVAHEREWYRSPPIEDAGNLNLSETDTALEEPILLYEDLIGLEGGSITELEPGSTELELYSGPGSRGPEYYMENIVSEAFSTGGDAVLGGSSVVLYNWLGSQVEQEYDFETTNYTYMADLVDYLEETDTSFQSEPNTRTVPGRLEGFENIRHRIAHDINAFSGFELEQFTDLLREVHQPISDGGGRLQSLLDVDLEDLPGHRYREFYKAESLY